MGASSSNIRYLYLTLYGAFFYTLPFWYFGFSIQVKLTFIWFLLFPKALSYHTYSSSNKFFNCPFFFILTLQTRSSGSQLFSLQILSILSTILKAGCKISSIGYSTGLSGSSPFPYPVTITKQGR